jgi:SAM-dependent methyltransferase
MASDATQQVITGAQYVEQITARESDRRARAAFLDLALNIMPAGAALFDFGAGPGIDARFYAEHGFSVAAYDVDAKMCEFFAAHCREHIDAGTVNLETGSYRDFLARHRAGGARRIDLVTANFAPLNLIGDLNELFAAFHALTAANGKVLASVLNPYFVGDMRYSWWWRNALQLWRHGHFSVPGAQAPIVRRRLADFCAQSAPYFKLAQVFRGVPSIHARHAGGIDVSMGHRYTWLHLTTCRFVFLLFTKGELQHQETPIRVRALRRLVRFSRP